MIALDEFLETQSLDGSTLDLYKISGDPQNLSSSVDAYLKRIGQVPLLEPEEEKTLFEKLHLQKISLAEILDKLQNSN